MNNLCKIKHCGIICCVLTVFTFSAKSQDGKAKVDLSKYEKVESSLYSQENGLWLSTSTLNTLFKSTTGKLYKYSADLSKKEWEIPTKGMNQEMIYNAKNPAYVYFLPDLTANIGIFSLNSGYRTSVFQVSAEGKMVEHKIPKEETYEDHIVAFCTSNQFCEVFTKKKSNDLIIAKYNHQNFNKSKAIIEIPALEKGEKMAGWYYAGLKDSVLALARHNKKLEKEIEVVLVNIETGEVLSAFYYKPNFSNIKSFFPSQNLRRDPGVVCPRYEDYSDGGKYLPSGYGDIHLAPDGKSLMHYALACFTSNKSWGAGSYADGYALTKLTLSGDEIWHEERLFSDKALFDGMKKAARANALASGIGITDLPHGTSFSLNFYYIDVYSKQGQGSFQYDYSGKKSGSCYKSAKFKGGFYSKVRSVVDAVEELYSCFIKNSDQMTRYIQNSNQDASYSVVGDNDAHVLIVHPVNGKTMELIYFK